MLGINWLFSPTLGVAYTPVWSRFQETFGEDPHLGSTMGSALIQGIQEIDPNGLPHQTAACMKHFIGYSAPINGRDRSPVYLPLRFLKQIFQPVFQHAVDSGVLTAMEGYHEV